MKTLILLLLVLPLLSKAQSITWSENNGLLSIGDRIELLEDKDGILSFEDVSSEKFRNSFSPSNSKILSLGYTDSYFWLRFDINNQSKEDILLELAQAGIPSADFYYRIDTSLIMHTKAGYIVGMADKTVKNSFQLFIIPPGQSVYFVRINSNSEPIPVNLYDRKTYELAANKQKIGYGIYLGLMIFVALNSIFLFISLHKRLYLFYALIVVLYMSYAAMVIDGFIVYLMPGVDLKFLYTTIPAFGITLQTIYCLVFLEAKKYTPKVYKIVSGIIIYFAIWMFAKFFFSFPIVQPINTVNALVSFLIMGIVGVKVGNNGNKMGYYFALAYFIYFLLVATQALYINTGSPKYLGGLSYVAYATLIEAFLLSFLLSRRFEWEKTEIERERLAAQVKVVEKTLENEKIIKEQKDKLEHQVAQRTIELQNTNQQLSDINSKLLDLNREKDGLINMVAHDLKSPLCSIIGFIELIKREGELNPKQNEYLSIIDSVSQDGMYLIDDFLDVHSFEYGDSKVNIKQIHLVEFVTDWLKTFNQQISNKEQKLILETNIETPLYQTDPFMLSRVLNNLLSNAIKFSQKGKSIFVSVSQTDKVINFSVKDEGPGISVNDQNLMFKRFQKLSARPTAGESSNGLGLSIVQALIEKLEGKIVVKSQLGVGTEFIISLPANYSTHTPS